MKKNISSKKFPRIAKKQTNKWNQKNWQKSGFFEKFWNAVLLLLFQKNKAKLAQTLTFNIDMWHLWSNFLHIRHNILQDFLKLVKNLNQKRRYKHWHRNTHIDTHTHRSLTQLQKERLFIFSLEAKSYYMKITEDLLNILEIWPFFNIKGLLI